MGQTFKKFFRKLIYLRRSILKLLELDQEELEILSKFLIDVSKGILGVPIVVYFVSGFSLLVLVGAFVLDLIVVGSCLIGAHALHRVAKRRKYG